MSQDCNDIKFGTNLLYAYYGECSKCYTFYEDISFKQKSYYVDCVNKKFIVYEDLECKRLQTEEKFNDYLKCDEINQPCCLMKTVYNYSGKLVIKLKNLIRCTDSCIGKGDSRYKKINDTYYDFFDANNCGATPKEDTHGELICMYPNTTSAIPTVPGPTSEPPISSKPTIQQTNIPTTPEQTPTPQLSSISATITPATDTNGIKKDNSASSLKKNLWKFFIVIIDLYILTTLFS